MDEFRDFSLDNLLQGGSNENEAAFSGGGGLALDLSGDIEKGTPEQDGTEYGLPEKPLILGPVQRPPPITDGPVTFTYAVERYYMDVRDGFRINSRGRVYAEGGHVRFGTLHGWLRKFAEKYGEVDLFQVTDGWLKHFIRFLFYHPIALNTVSSLIDNVHAVIGGYITDGLPLNRLTVRVWPEVADAVFNPLEELELIQQTSYSHHALTQVSDIFVMQSFLGFRVGTLERFLANPQLYIFSQRDKWFLRIRTNKTGAIVVVPLKEIVLVILKRRQYRFDSVYYERYYNRLIKLMAKEAGIQDPVPYSQTIGGKMQQFIEPKNDLMSSHTARRNFATNAYLAGVPVDNIMWITGHSTREAFFRYIRADSLANALAISGHPFFR